MKNNPKEPVQVLLTYNPNSIQKNHLKAKIVTGIEEKPNNVTKLDDNHKLVRRYSIDDNGGGYLGL